MRSDSLSYLEACLRGDRVGEPSCGWDSVLAEASDQALLPALFGLIGEVAPPEIARFLAEVESANRERNEVILGELKAAVELLNAAGIEPVLLKGSAYFATGVYGDPAHRYLVDVDLLVADEQRAASVLLAHGYVAEDRDAWGHFRHHYPPLRSPRAVSFELHHRMGLPRCEKVLTAREVLEGASHHDLEGVRVRIPCAEHLLTHLIVHSQLQCAYNERIWPPLRALWDLALMERRFGAELNWDGVMARFQAAGCYRLAALHVMQVEAALKPGLSARPRIDGLTRALWLRREAIRKVPALRYADPAYMYATVLGRRMALLRNAIGTRAGIRHLLGQVAAPGNYARLWTDLIEGRGR